MVRDRNELAHRKELAPQRPASTTRAGLLSPNVVVELTISFQSLRSQLSSTASRSPCKAERRMLWSLFWLLQQNPMDLGLEHQTFTSISHRLGAGSQGANVVRSW